MDPMAPSHKYLEAKWNFYAPVQIYCDEILGKLKLKQFFFHFYLRLIKNNIVTHSLIYAID
jgi:hypothetical protein